MKKTLYLHIGTPKTATTSLQKFFVENQELLQKKGYCYPMPEYKYPEVGIYRNGHFLLGRIYLPPNEEGKKKRDKKMEKQLWEEGMALVHKSFETYPNVVLSDEGIWHAIVNKKFSMWKNLQADADAFGYEIRVIVYFRRQDELAYSWLCQQTKHGTFERFSTKSWEAYKTDVINGEDSYITLDYDVYLRRLADIIGKENICVRLFDRSLFEGNGNSIYSDFLLRIGLEFSDEYVITEEEANISLTGNRQELMRIANVLCGEDRKARAKCRRMLTAAEVDRAADNKFTMFDPAQLEGFLGRYREGNEYIAREFLGKEDGELFADKGKKDPVWTPNNAYMPEDLLRLMIPLYLEQRAEIAALKEKLSLSEKALKERIRNVEQCSFFFRLRRKCRYLLGKLRGQ